MPAVATAALWAGAIGCGVMAGIYFAFSTFVMKALATLPSAAGVAAMQAINRVIISSLFAPLFFGTTLIGLVLAGWSLARWEAPGAGAMLAGGSVYVLGMFVCTIALNVPLNDALAGLDPQSPQAASLWPDYLLRWTKWNHVRTVASAVASGLFIAVIAARA